jgi:hypothetical protein
LRFLKKWGWMIGCEGKGKEVKRGRDKERRKRLEEG